MKQAITNRNKNLPSNTFVGLLNKITSQSNFKKTTFEYLHAIQSPQHNFWDCFFTQLYYRTCDFPRQKFAIAMMQRKGYVHTLNLFTRQGKGRFYILNFFLPHFSIWPILSRKHSCFLNTYGRLKSDNIKLHQTMKECINKILEMWA